MISRGSGGQTMADRAEVSSGGLEVGFSSTKKQILLTLKKEGAVSLTDLAASVHISKMATLKHLTVLETKGLVERSSRPGGRGRPRAFFALSAGSASLFPEAYTHMTLCALRFIEEKIGREAIVRLLRQRAQEVLDANRNRVPDVADDDLPEHVLSRTPRLPGSGRPGAIPRRMGSPGGVRLVRAVGRRPGLPARKGRPSPRRPTRGDRPRPERVRRLVRGREC